MSSGCRPFFCMSPISLRSMPSSPTGRCSSTMRDVVAGRVDVGVAEHHEGPRRPGVDEPHGGLEHDDAGALGADERAGDVEAVLGQQLVEVVARHAPRDLGEAAADRVGVAVAQVAQARVDLAAAPAGGDDARRARLGVAAPDGHAVPS